MKIIIIDDEIAALKTFLQHIVDDLKIEYKMFYNDPEAAAEYCEKNPVDAAFLDINMPKINGVDLAEKLIAKRPALKIVFISAYTQDEAAIAARLKNNLAGYCYKPYASEMLFRYIDIIREEVSGRNIEIRTFGIFGLFIGGNAVRFSSSKSKELLALLVDKNGAQLSLGQTIAFLWPDKNPEHAKILYRDAVWRLRDTLEQNGLENLVVFQRAMLTLNKNGISCDYFDFLNNIGREKYLGEYMTQYEWSMDTQNYLNSFDQ